MSDRPLYETMAVQHPAELDAFVEMIAGECIESYLEIGAKFGGTLWRVAQVMRPRSRIVAVDLPRGTVAWPESEPSLRSCIDQLIELGHEACVVWGDSMDAAVIETVRKLGPFDLVFIDANHTLDYVTADWKNYGPFGRIVAFHDIAWRRDEDEFPRFRIDVPVLWQSLRQGFRHAEICLDPKRKDNGIGVLWWE